MKRCGWARHPLEIDYHDKEWGAPVRDDRLLFEFLVLEGAQAGLSWLTILKKRDAYRAAFDNFEIETVAAYDEPRTAALLANPGIVRNRQKIASAVGNARAGLALRRELGSLSEHLWTFVGGQPLVRSWQDYRDAPATSPEAEAMSRDLRRRGFRFVGPTICYAFMQAVGMVNDHQLDCFRRKELAVARPGSS